MLAFLIKITCETEILGQYTHTHKHNYIKVMMRMLGETVRVSVLERPLTVEESSRATILKGAGPHFFVEFQTFLQL